MKRFIHTFYECSCEYQTLKDGKEIILQGDYYHDKIAEKIEGFIEGCFYAGMEVEVGIEKEECCENCKEDC